MQNELTPRELTNNELVMLDALTYYSQLSDKYTKAEGSPYRKIIDFVDDAISQSDPFCF